MDRFNVIVIHGAYGYPEENWFGWLKKELEKEGLSCQVPPFPTPRGQSLKNWIRVFNETCARQLNSRTILIGHSLGAVFVLRYLELHPINPAAVILVGAFIGKVNHAEFDDLNRDFLVEPFNWSLIRSRSQRFLAFQGANDPYVSLAVLDHIAEGLKAEKIVIPQGGHLNAASGYRKFPLLLSRLKQLREEQL
jgi:predicted alpha/beta hydrolase family esterase